MSTSVRLGLGPSGTAVQWRVLGEVGHSLSGRADPAIALSEAAKLVVPETADCCVLYLAGDDELPAVLEVAHVEDSRTDEIRDRMRGLLSATGSKSLLRQLNLQEAGSRGWEDGRSLLTSLRIASGTVAPLRLRGRTRGLLVLSIGARGPDAANDVAFGQALADRISVELECALAQRQSARAVAASELAVGIVSHDLGNPLATIQICANALLDPEPQPAGSIRQIAEIIHRSGAWMQQIIRDLLDRVSLDAGRLPFAREPVAVSDVMDTTETMFLPVAREHGVDFAIESAADLPRVDADAHRLQQALSNLLGNAMKFTPSGGRVVLSARESGDKENGRAIRFEVSDTGPGIPEQDLPHVFDWLWHSQTGERTGSGLGLAIAKGVIEAHSTHLMVESVPGHGSTFWFTLPACERTGEERRRGLEARR
jgi:signal transduction histidine kinase